MLLLLESRPVFNQAVYRRVVGKLVDAYFRDVAGHEESFRPIFVVNDILRYWKTLCLNYEQRRNDPAARREQARVSHQIKNLKLKFSRMLTCFSTIAALVSHRAISRQEVLALVDLTPIERLRQATAGSEYGKKLFASVAELYSWFLDRVGRDEAGVRSWLSSSAEKRRAFQRADEFGAKMFELIQHSADPELFRYLVI
jgi:hypothetical protein